MSEHKKISVILDGDPGHDDAIAWVLARASRDLGILAVTSCCGNQTIEKTTYNALRVCTLIGLHAPVPCEDCHKSASYKGTATSCASCHTDARHQSRLGSQCATCHTPNGWRLWRFEHDRQTRFGLAGAHKSLDCHACHKDKGPKATAPTTCIGCHRQDDAHQGAFGSACDKCHTTSSFREGTRAR